MPDLLTRRQLEVVRVYVEAGGAKPAAHALGVRPGTVRAMLSSARTRAGVDTTSQLVRELSRRGEL
jgi:DNA-binding NarL/FixJ family response regulator